MLSLADLEALPADERFTKELPETERWQKVGPALFANTPSIGRDDDSPTMQRIADRIIFN